MTRMAGGYPLYTVNQFQDFKECLEGIASLYAQRPLFVLYDADGTEHTYTYATFAADARALAASLISLGLEGKHIALVGENSYAWVVTLFAITTIGSVAVTVDTEQPTEAISAMVRRADAQAVFCTEPYAAQFLALQQDEKTLSHVIALDDTIREGMLSIENLIRMGQMRIWMSDKITIDPDQMAMIVYTSGTTSTSKPVMLSHRNMMSNCCNAASMVSMGPKVFVSLPLYHTYGLTAGLMAHLTQGLVICINGNLKTTMRDIVLFQPTSITAVPLLIEALYGRIRMELRKRGAVEKANRLFEQSHVKYVKPRNLDSDIQEAVHAALGKEARMFVCGGAYLNHHVAENMQALGIQIIEGYGITECSPMVTANRNEAQDLHSVGLIMPDMEVRIVDDEIWVRGVSVSKGYYRDDLLTQESFRDGWFRTGDLGALNKDGFLRIEGRKKTLIVFMNGKKVTPEEIENYVADIPLIREAMAYGVSAGESNDDVKLGLMVYPNPELTQGLECYEVLQLLQAEIDKLNRKLPSYKQIQIIKIKESPFEKTALQKIKRHAV